MFIVRRVEIRQFERGLMYRDGEFSEILRPGRYWIFDLTGQKRLDIVSVRKARFAPTDLDAIVKSGKLEDEAVVLDLKDFERALVWIDGRFDSVLGPGTYAYWKVFQDVIVEFVDARTIRFEHQSLPVILANPGTASFFEMITVETGFVGLLFIDGSYVEALRSGRYAFWTRIQSVLVKMVSIRESNLELTGQEIMTSDKVTLRLNAVVTFRVIDPLAYATVSEDGRQTLYREAQLALRESIGSMDLDMLLANKDTATQRPEAILKARAREIGVEIGKLGIRDIILPGDMKELLNKVTEAKKVAEANLISRREETAAIRSQANTAKILETNPVLMRLKELEVLEKIALTSKLQVVLGEKGLADRVVNLL